MILNLNGYDGLIYQQALPLVHMDDISSAPLAEPNWHCNTLRLNYELQ